MSRLLLLFLLSARMVWAASSVTQFGVTWTFDASYTTGQYANGDHYVVAPSGLTITAISPASTYTQTSSATVTISNATPAVVTWTAHGLEAGALVILSTTGALPSPLVEGTIYYVSSSGVNTNSFQISATLGGSSIATTTAGSGTHTAATGRVINGAMVNPTAGTSATQGFDSSLAAFFGASYSAALNVARPSGSDLSGGNPLVISAGSSLVSTISHATAGQLPQLTDAAVLTVVASAPSAGSFRPPYCGSDKTHYWNKSGLNYSILRSLATVTGTPTLATVAADFERPWIEINTIWTGRYWHPSNNQPDYGRDMAYEVGPALLSLHLNYTEAEKETLFVRLAQYGLDVYGAAVTGATWPNDGGHSLGRKAPLVLAGLAFNDSNVLAYANAATNFIFQEDQQTWYVIQSDVGRDLLVQEGYPREEYIQADVGLPEWGEKHTGAPDRDGRNWDASYRDINYSPLMAHALAIQLTTGGVAAWNGQVFFDYHDRAKTVATSPEFTTFTNNMWDTYRSLGGPLWTAPGNTTRSLLKPAGARRR